MPPSTSPPPLATSPWTVWGKSSLLYFQTRCHRESGLTLASGTEHMSQSPVPSPLTTMTDSRMWLDLQSRQLEPMGLNSGAIIWANGEANTLFFTWLQYGKIQAGAKTVLPWWKESICEDSQPKGRQCWREEGGKLVPVTQSELWLSRRGASPALLLLVIWENALPFCLS